MAEAEDVELYVATLLEVRRQMVQLGGGGDGGSGAPSRSASDNSGWVVLESATTPAQLPGDAGCSVWPQQQWQIAYEILFCQCPTSVARLRPHQADDLLFFVHADEAAAAARARLFVRRRQPKQRALPPDLGRGGGGGGARGGGAARVDWRASVLLMVVLQSAYRLSVVTAADADRLSRFVDGGGATAGWGGGGGGGGGGGAAAPAPGVSHVVKVVHASPSHVPVNVDLSRSDAGAPAPCYPNICFAVDDPDDALQAQVLREPSDCYCVLLHADVAASWRLPSARAAGGGAGGAGEAAVDAASARLAGLSVSQQQLRQPGGGGSQHALRTASSRSSSGGWQSATSDAGCDAATVFSGYVSKQQLAGALGGQLAGDPVRKALRDAAAAARGAAGEQPLATCHVVMRGPAGRGAADVAVSSYAPPTGDGAAAAEDPPPAPAGSRPGLLQRAGLLARGVAAAAKQATAGPRGGAAGLPASALHLRCGLMTLQVPVDMLAESVLGALRP